MSAGRFAGKDAGAARPTSIIGVDCATVPSRTGLARAVRTADGWHLLDVQTCSDAVRPEAVVANWLSDEPRSLLAVDAPLGWPAELGETLAPHNAGEALSVPPARMFRRATDRFVHERLHKKPLDVGADKIAHTAWAALRLLGELRGSTGHDLPLAWSAAAPSLPAVIEVYPAATLMSHRLPSTSYKAPGSAARTAIQEFINRRLTTTGDVNALSVGEHALDAVLCVVAGLDFLAGTCYEPEEKSVARREGWIWVKKSSD